MMPAVPMRDALLSKIHERMATRDDIFFVTADFGSPVLDKIRKDYPGRYVNVGIAEQNLINVSAGLAIEGFVVYAYAIAPFLTMRAYEQIRNNLVLLSSAREMNVNLIGVGAGLSYGISGPTHHCLEDIAAMRIFPGMTVCSVADHVAAAAFADFSLETHGCKYVRLDAKVLPCLHTTESVIDFEKGFSCLRKGERACFVATGYMTHTALAACETLRQEGVACGVIDMLNLSTCDTAALAWVLRGYSAVVVAEEGFAGCGGLDSLVYRVLSESGNAASVRTCSFERGYATDLGSREELHDRHGLGLRALCAAVKDSR